MNGRPMTSEKHTFCTGISSNGSDDSPYSWTEKPFHPYTDRYKNAPVCRTTSQSEATTNLVMRNDFPIMQPTRNIPLIYRIYRYVRYAFRPCQTKRYLISRHYERRENSYTSIEKTPIPSFSPLAFRNLTYRSSIPNAT